MATEGKDKKQPFWKKAFWEKFFWKDYDITRKELGVFLAIVVVVVMGIPNLLANKYFYWVDFSNTGQIGDTIGGITAPFLSLLGSVLVFIAFKEQIKANKLVQAQFASQEFETQFFEMLKLHKENVNEIFLTTSSTRPQLGVTNTQYKGREVLHEAINCIQDINGRLDAALVEYKNTLLPLKEELLQFVFEECYSLFWWGKHRIKKEEDEKLYDFLARYSYKSWETDWHKRLGHYYRHLFHIATLIDESSAIPKEKKYHYYKILRSQLSNAEQVLLFYNWCAGYGSNWENEQNHFFTESKLIHNLPTNKVIQNKFFEAKLEELRTKAKTFKIEKLFEIEGG